MPTTSRSTKASSFGPCGSAMAQTCSAMVLVRDDFAMAAARFMRALEIRLIESDNFATVDPFDLVHARKVLARVRPGVRPVRGREMPGFLTASSIARSPSWQRTARSHRYGWPCSRR